MQKMANGYGPTKRTAIFLDAVSAPFMAHIVKTYEGPTHSVNTLEEPFHDGNYEDVRSALLRLCEMEKFIFAFSYCDGQARPYRLFLKVLRHARDMGISRKQILFISPNSFPVLTLLDFKNRSHLSRELRKYCEAKKIKCLYLAPLPLYSRSNTENWFQSRLTGVREELEMMHLF